MIAPSNFREGMTRAEAVAGYLEDGETPADAEMLADVLLNPSPDGLPVI